MKLEDIQPGHCYARTRQLLAELELVRAELGRTKEARHAPQVAGASPRACYFQALAIRFKAARLGSELGAHGNHGALAAPRAKDIVPGHVLDSIDAAAAQLAAVKRTLGLGDPSPEAAAEAARTPSDVLGVLIEANRALTRLLEQPPTPTDVYRIVALAYAYATRLAGKAVELPRFEPQRVPADCYARLAAALEAVGARVTQRGHAALVLRGSLADVTPADCFDLAHSVLGEVAFLHDVTPHAHPVQPYEPSDPAHRLPSHVFQLVRALETQLAA